MRNVLITAVRNFDNRETCNCLYVEDGKSVKFVDGVVFGEAGCKYILSKMHIDEIIVVGSDIQASNDMVGVEIPLNKGIELSKSDISTLSDFDYFRYRIMQFIEGVDMETLDIYESIPKDRKDKILEILDSTFGSDKKNIIKKIYDKPSLYDDFIKKIENLNYQEKIFVNRYIYANADNDYYLKCEKNSGDIPITFVPISRVSEGSNLMTSFGKLVNAIYDSGETDVNAYIDVQGLSQIDSFIILSLLSAINDNPIYTFNIMDIISSSDVPRGFVYKIGNSRKRINVERFLSGINALLNDGRTKQLREYWDSVNIKNEYIDKIMIALGKVETNLLLCSLDTLEENLKEVMEIANIDNVSVSNSEEEEFIKALRQVIIKDYQQMVNYETKEINLLELLKWTYNKGYYQQCMTLIESKIPIDMIKKGIFYPCETYSEKEKYIKAYNALYWDAPDTEKWKYRDVSHYFVKNYGSTYYCPMKPRGVLLSDFQIDVRSSQIFLDKPLGKLLKAHSIIKDENKFKNIYGAYVRLGQLRNHINHAENIEDEVDTEISVSNDVLITYVKSELKKFIDVYEETLNDIEGITFTQVDILQTECDEYFKTHGPKFNHECFEVEGFVTSNVKYARLMFKDESRK